MKDMFMPTADQPIVVQTLETKSLLTSLCKGRKFPSLAKRGGGRFSGEYVFSIMDSFVNENHYILSPLIFLPFHLHAISTQFYLDMNDRLS